MNQERRSVFVARLSLGMQGQKGIVRAMGELQDGD